MYAASNLQTATSSVSNYQEVFAQMKSQNPTASLGALQQKTMTRMAEMKKQRLAEQERIKQQEEHERLKKEEDEKALKLKQTLAVKYMSKWMKKVDLEFKEDESDRNKDGTAAADSNTQDTAAGSSSNTSQNNQRSTLPRAQIHKQGSFKRNSLDSSGTGRNMNNNNSYRDSDHNNSDNILTQFIPTGARNSIMMAGRNTILINRNNRRSSIDTNYTTQSSQLDNSTTKEDSLNDSHSMMFMECRINAGLIGEDQGNNFAPRRSVGDLSSVHRLNSNGGLICDGSDRSGLTDDASGLLTDVDSVNQLSIFSGKSSTKSRKSLGGDDDDHLNIEDDEDENDYVEQGDNSHTITDDDDDDCVSRLSDCVSRLSLHGAEDIEENEREKRARHMGLNNDDDDIGEGTSRSRSSDNRLSQSLTTTRSDATSFARSVTSDFTTDVSIMSCGLIVGFTDRRSLADHNGLIVEFSDRSSIIEKRRRERVKKRASRATNNDNEEEEEDDDEHTHDIEDDINAWKEK